MVCLVLKSLVILLLTVHIYPYLGDSIAVRYDVQIILFLCYVKAESKAHDTRCDIGKSKVFTVRIVMCYRDVI